MSEKFKNGWRELADVFVLSTVSIFYVLLMFALHITVLLIKAVIVGAILMACWNIAMPTMFGFSKITVIQAAVIEFTLEWLRYDAFSIAKPVYATLEFATFNLSQNERMSRIATVISFIVFSVASILVTVLVTRYTWNSILPNLLNAKLVHITFGQALGFACLFNWLFGNWDMSEPDDSDDMDETDDV